MSVKTTLKKIQSALTGIQNLKSFHGFAESSKELPYCVWWENGESSSFEANNHKAEQALDGFVYYYTKTDFDSMVDSIQSALNGVENLSWRYDAVIYGDPSHDDNNVIQHTWSWSIRVNNEVT